MKLPSRSVVSGGPRPSPSSSPGNRALTLPTTLSKPATDLRELSALYYGLEKIGKTSFLAEFEDNLFLMCEPGSKGLSILKRDVMNWKEFVGYIDLLEADRSLYQMITVDTADRCFKMCEKHVLTKLAIQHASDEDFGKGYSMIRDEFAFQIDRLLKLGRGVAFTSHAVEKEIKNRNGQKYDRVMPTMPKQAREILEPIIDIWGYMEYDEKEARVLRLRGDSHVAAGHRLQHNFVGVDTIPMGKTPKEAYDNFVAAFQNETVPSSAPAPKAKLTLRR